MNHSYSNCCLYRTSTFPINKAKIHRRSYFTFKITLKKLKDYLVHSILLYVWLDSNSVGPVIFSSLIMKFPVQLEMINLYDILRF